MGVGRPFRAAATLWRLSRSDASLSSDVPTILSVDDVLSMHDTCNAVVIDADCIKNHLGKDWLDDLGQPSRPVFIIFHGLFPDKNTLAVLAHVCQYPQVKLMCDVM